MQELQLQMWVVFMVILEIQQTPSNWFSSNFLRWFCARFTIPVLYTKIHLYDVQVFLTVKNTKTTTNIVYSHVLRELFSFLCSSCLHSSAMFWALFSHWSLSGPLLKDLRSSFFDNILLSRRHIQTNMSLRVLRCISSVYPDNLNLYGCACWTAIRLMY